MPICVRLYNAHDPAFLPHQVPDLAEIVDNGRKIYYNVIRFNYHLKVRNQTEQIAWQKTIQDLPEYSSLHF